MAKYKIAHVNLQGIDLVLIPLDPRFGRLNPKQKAQSTAQLQRIVRLAGLRGAVVPVWDAGDGGLRVVAEPNVHPLLQALTPEFIYANINREIETHESLESAPAEPILPSVLRQRSQPPGAGAAAPHLKLRLETMVFTDMVDSTKLKQTLGDHAALELIRWHHAQVRSLLSQFPAGEEISTAGDSFFLVFQAPSEAVRFALQLQARMRQGPGGGKPALKDRIGIHVGEVFVDEQAVPGKLRDCHGIHVDFSARIMSLAEGGQILMTRFVLDSARQMLKDRAIEGVAQLSFLNHGLYKLKGIEDPVEVCEVGEVGAARLAAPPDTEKAQRYGEPRRTQAGRG